MGASSSNYFPTQLRSHFAVALRSEKKIDLQEVEKCFVLDLVHCLLFRPSALANGRAWHRRSTVFLRTAVLGYPYRLFYP
jgi:hypothetical protein